MKKARDIAGGGLAVHGALSTRECGLALLKGMDSLHPQQPFDDGAANRFEWVAMVPEVVRTIVFYGRIGHHPAFVVQLHLSHRVTTPTRTWGGVSTRDALRRAVAR